MSIRNLTMEQSNKNAEAISAALATMNVATTHGETMRQYLRETSASLSVISQFDSDPELLKIRNLIIRACELYNSMEIGALELSAKRALHAAYKRLP